MLYRVTKAFQFRGGGVRRGSMIELSSEQLKDKFIAAHIDINSGIQPEEPVHHIADRNYLVPPSAVSEKPALNKKPVEDMNMQELRTELKELGVHYSPRMPQTDLANLLNQARDAIAGSKLSQ